MATYRVIFSQRNDNTVVIQTLTEPLIEVGEVFVPTGFQPEMLSTNYLVQAKPQYLFLGLDSAGNFLYDFNVPLANQLLYFGYGVTAADSERARVTESPVTLTHNHSCTWINGPAVATYLGIDLAGADETAFLTQCANAANNFIFLRRQESGYTDSLTTSPGTPVTLAVTMYAAAMYRQRGSVDQFASFDGMGNVPTTGLSPIIKQLAGIPKPAVA